MLIGWSCAVKALKQIIKQYVVGRPLIFRFYFIVLLSEEKHSNFGMLMESQTHQVSCKVSEVVNFAKDLTQLFLMIQ